MKLKWKCILIQRSSGCLHQLVEVYLDVVNVVVCHVHHECFTVGWRCLRTDWAEQNHIA